MINKIIISSLCILGILLLTPLSLGFMTLVFVSIFGSWTHPNLITTTSGFITAIFTILFTLSFSLQSKLYQIIEKQNVNLF